MTVGLNLEEALREKLRGRALDLSYRKLDRLPPGTPPCTSQGVRAILGLWVLRLF